MDSAPYSPARTPFLWRLRTTSLPLGDRTRLMAILNLTPDSFSGDGLLPDLPSGRHAPPSPAAIRLAVGTALEALDAGADILDLGAESTRPNAPALSADQEQERLLPVLSAILRARPHAILSVDTYHAATARQAARAGAQILNDVSGLAWDPDMAQVAAQTGCGLILAHSRGRPRQWLAQGPMTRNEILPEVFAGLCESLALAESAGIATDRIVLDPGFGFGKQGEENFTLLAGLRRLRQLDRPLLIGLSRKRFLAATVSPLQPPGLPLPEARRSATLAANVAAILSGAHILRVHDLQATREAAAVADQLLLQS